MANGDIKITITVDGPLADGTQMRPFSVSKTISSIADVIDRTITVPTSEITVLQIAATVAGDTLSTLNFMVVYNADTTDTVEVGMIRGSVDSAYFKIPPGKMFVLGDDDMFLDDDAAAESGTFQDITKITLQSLSGSSVCQLVAW